MRVRFRGSLRVRVKVRVRDRVRTLRLHRVPSMHPSSCANGLKCKSSKSQGSGVVGRVRVGRVRVRVRVGF